MFSHILVPTDGSELSNKAITYAATLAKSMGGRITAFFAKPPHQLAQAGDAFLNDLLAPDKFEERADRLARECLEDAVRVCRTLDVPCNTVAVASEAPYQAILDTAQREGCDLILMASHGRSGLSGLLIGSETKKVLVHATLPVLVYR